MSRKYKLPNSPLVKESFQSEGGFELWNLMVQLWFKVGRLEIAVAIGGGALLILASGMAGRVFEVW